MLRKKYINNHKSILYTKYLINNTYLKFISIKKINFFFCSISKKENLAIFKNIFIFLIAGKAVNSNYSKLYINQLFNNLYYILSLTKSYYSIDNLYLIQKLFLMLNNNYLYLNAGFLNRNTFYSYSYANIDSFIEKYLVYETKYVQQKTFITSQFKWPLKLQLNIPENTSLTLSSLFFFDVLNLCALPFFGSFLEKKQIHQMVEKIK